MVFPVFSASREEGLEAVVLTDRRGGWRGIHVRIGGEELIRRIFPWRVVKLVRG